MFKKIFVIFLLIVNGSVFAIKQKPLVIVLDWYVNPNHAPLFVAEQEGFFAKRGVAVKFIAPAEPAQGEKMVAANKADIAISYQPRLIHNVTSGLPLMHLATLINIPLNCLVVLKNSSIYSVKDLKGKRIGYSATGTNNIALTTMLKTVGLNTNDIELVGVKFNLTQALLTGKIDGFVGGMRNFEPAIMELAGKSVRLFYPEKYGFPSYDELILVTNKNKINDPALIGFVEALQQGVDYLRDHPQESWQKFAKNHPELNNRLNEKAWYLTLPCFAINPAKLDKVRYQNLAKFMFKEKLIPYVPNIESFAQELKVKPIVGCRCRFKV